MHLRSIFLLAAGLLAVIAGTVRAVPDLARVFAAPLDDEPEIIVQYLTPSRPVSKSETNPAASAHPTLIPGLSPSFQALAAGFYQQTESLAEEVTASIPAEAGYDRVGGAAAMGANNQILDIEAKSQINQPAVPQEPVQLLIPAIGLDAPVVPARSVIVEKNKKQYLQWLAPESFAAGWHVESALLGEVGNTVLNGHHNVYGEIFRRLDELKSGDQILVRGQEHTFEYLITNVMIVPEKYETIDARMENARWILPSDDERLTLITCWPYESNTHRLIIVASRVK
jgi:LPXTG-site transpeptidase (sortase) family protein